MNKAILLYKLKIFAIVLLSLISIVVVEGLVTMNDCTSVLKNIFDAPMDLVRYIPIIILSYLLSSNMIQIFNGFNSELQFEINSSGIIFFQDFHIWLAIFETFSVEKIQMSELKQLKHLKTFSLEIDKQKMSVRVILYSKSIKELKKRIRKSKPILEVVLPNINLVPKDEIAQRYNEMKLLKIGRDYIFKEKSELIHPQFGNFPKKNSHSISRLVLTCNIPDETRNDGFMNSTQMYFFHRFNQASFFRYINKRYFKSPRETLTQFQDNQEHQRIRLSYQTDKKPLLSFQEGLDQYTRALSFISPGSGIVKTEERRNNYPLIKNQQKLLLDTEKTSFLEMNQICYELCNLPKENKYSNKEKVKRCKKRANFCLNLLESENFSLILESLIKQENIIDQIHLMSELRRHLTYHQILCCFSHLSQLNYPKISYLELINLIHILFRSIDEAKVPNINKKPSSLIFTIEGENDQISSSLTPN